MDLASHLRDGSGVQVIGWIGVQVVKWISVKGLPGQGLPRLTARKDSQDRTGRTGQPVHTVEPERGRQILTGRTGQAEQDCHDWNIMTGLVCQDRAARTRLSG